VVTGASSGIGAVEAVKVDLATPEGVEQLYARIHAHGDRLEAVA
jgi:NAD(P)-dependent dehydrogenase (short-subunit alcohol dehydrogenase family)